LRRGAGCVEFVRWRWWWRWRASGTDIESDIKPDVESYIEPNAAAIHAYLASYAASAIDADTSSTGAVKSNDPRISRCGQRTARRLFTAQR
jgi:hypothetical protein